MKSMMQLLTEHPVEQPLGKLSLLDLLSTLQRVEKMRAELKAKNPNMKMEVIRTAEEGYKIVLRSLIA
jgi:hypothetical protein